MLSPEEKKKLDDVIAKTALLGYIYTSLKFLGRDEFEHYVDRLEQRIKEYKSLRAKELGSVVSD